MKETRLKNKAVLLDRDGVINDLVYNREEGNIGSPLSSKQMHIFPYAASAINEIQRLGYLVVLVSNQPGVAKKQFSYVEHKRMVEKLRKELKKSGCQLDGEYYCMHHPNALVPKFRKVCNCRKPKPGLILKAAKELKIDLKNSYVVGDSVVDVKAGKAAGCKTIFIGNVTGFLTKILERERAEPDFVLGSVKEAPKLLRSLQTS